MKRHECWTPTAQPHPWEDIADVACGYVQRLADAGCRGCYRSRSESPEEQLQEAGNERKAQHGGAQAHP